MLISQPVTSAPLSFPGVKEKSICPLTVELTESTVGASGLGVEATVTVCVLLPFSAVP